MRPLLLMPHTFTVKARTNIRVDPASQQAPVRFHAFRERNDGYEFGYTTSRDTC
jgi:hypothetical protein